MQPSEGRQGVQITPRVIGGSEVCSHVKGHVLVEGPVQIHKAHEGRAGGDRTRLVLPLPLLQRHCLSPVLPKASNLEDPLLVFPTLPLALSLLQVTAVSLKQDHGGRGMPG